MRKPDVGRRPGEGDEYGRHAHALRAVSRIVRKLAPATSDLDDVTIAEIVHFDLSRDRVGVHWRSAAVEKHADRESDRVSARTPRIPPRFRGCGRLAPPRAR